MMEPFDIRLPKEEETLPLPPIEEEVISAYIRDKRKREFLEISDPSYDQIEANRKRTKIEFLKKQYNIEDKDFMDYLMINREDIDNNEAKNYQKITLLKSYNTKKRELDNKILGLILDSYTKIRYFTMFIFGLISVFYFLRSTVDDISSFYVILPVLIFFVSFVFPDKYKLKSVVKIFIDLNDTKDKISTLK